MQDVEGFEADPLVARASQVAALAAAAAATVGTPITSSRPGSSSGAGPMSPGACVSLCAHVHTFLYTLSRFLFMCSSFHCTYRFTTYAMAVCVCVCVS